MDTRQVVPTNTGITIAALRTIASNYQGSGIFYSFASLVGFTQDKVNEQIEFERLLRNTKKQPDSHYLTADELLPWIDYVNHYHNHSLGKAVATLLQQLNGNPIYGKLLVYCHKMKQLDSALLNNVLSANEETISVLYSYIKKSHNKSPLANSILNCAFIMRKESQKKLSNDSIIKFIDDLISINQLSQETASIIAKRRDAEESSVFIILLKFIDSYNKNGKQPSDLTATELHQIIPPGGIDNATIFSFKALSEMSLLNKEAVAWLAKEKFQIYDIDRLQTLQENKLINQHNMKWIRKNESYLPSIRHVFKLLNGYYSLQQLINLLPDWPPYDDEFINKLTQAVESNNIDLVKEAIEETQNTMLPIEDSLAALGLLTNDVRSRLTPFKHRIKGHIYDERYNELRHAINTCVKHLQLTDDLLNIVINHYEDDQSQMLHAMIEKVWPLLSKNKLLTYDNSFLIQKLLAHKSDYYISIIKKCKVADRAQQLTQKCFETIINLHYSKLPKTLPTQVTFHNKKKNNLSNLFTYFNDGTEIVISSDKNNNENAHGSFASIDKCYMNSRGNQSTVCIKKLHYFKYIDQEDILKTARNEVKYHHLLGRKTAFYFTKPGSKEICVVYPWQEGAPLFDIPQKERCAIPMHNRLLAFSTFMQELVVLHGLFRMHGDITAKNVILNTHKNTMTLIDFGLSRKNTGKFSSIDGSRLFSNKRSPDEHTVVLDDHLLDPKKPSRFSFSGEIYMASFILIRLFPELFSATYYTSTPPSVKKMKKDNVTPLEQAIYHLYDAMRARHDKRCLATDAVDFCQAVLAKGDTAQKDDIDTISNNTLYRATLTMNDALHGKTERLTF